MSNSGKLIIFAAPSGAGKSSFIKKIIKDSKNNLELSVSATTRLPREGEIHGKDYFFISEKEFNELKNNQAFLEFANVHGHQYGTIKSFVDERLGEGIHVILDIDVQGFTQIQRAITKDIVSIFIIPPSFDELKRRLILRGLDSNDAIDKRLENARKELEQAENFDYLVLNDDFNMAYNEITSIIFDKDYEYNVTNNKNILKDLLN